MSDGTVWGWGNENPMPLHVSGLTGVKSISLSYFGNLALKSDGTVWLWNNDGSPTTQVQGLTDVKEVVAAGYALKNDGTVWTFINDASISRPIQLQGLKNVVEITDHQALECDGTVWKLTGNPRNGDNVVVQVIGLNNVTSLISEGSEGLVMKNDGTVWEWGWIRTKAITGFVADNLTPYQIPITDVKKVSGGGLFFVALKSDGTVWAWGNNLWGQLGDGTITPLSDDSISRTIPHQVEGLSNVIDVAGGSDSAIALKSDGTVWAWGNNNAGQLGVDAKSGVDYSPVPRQVPGLSGITSVYMGSLTCFALKEDGSLWAWGANDYGQVGDGTIGNPIYNHGQKDPPVKVLIDVSSNSIASSTVVPSSTISASNGMSNGTSTSSNSTAQPSIITPTFNGTSNVNTRDIPVLGVRTIAILAISLLVIIGIVSGTYLILKKK